MSFIMLLIFFSLFHHFTTISASSKCQESFQCEVLGSLTFPLTNANNPDCGLFPVEGCDSTGTPRIRLDKGFWYDILQQISTDKFLVFDPTLQNKLQTKSCSVFANQSPSQSPTSTLRVLTNLTLFTCTNQSYSDPIQEYFNNYSNKSCEFFTVYYKHDHPSTIAATSPIPSHCSMMQLPMKSDQNSTEIFDMLTSQYVVEVEVSEDCKRCHNRGGRCRSNNEAEFYCKKAGNSKRIFRKTFLIVGVTTSALAAISIIIFLLIWRRHALLELLRLQNAKSVDEKDFELFLKNKGSAAPTRYRYSHIKKMTNSFNERLGQGGYGTVYKGKLSDNRLVAVKILNESRGNGEEFMNEVASISRTSHVSIVTLLGFCFEGSRRALVYEFMPNGSLEKFLQNRTSSPEDGGLGWQKLFEIALGIARGLDYLHQGCKTRILHLDIKPHNILLDKDLNPRISDFGLAKLCPNRSSIVSMLVARGTMGYIAPELLCRSFGDVSYKSDVYSYGITILEIVGWRKINSLQTTDRTSETYFSRYIYKQFEIELMRRNSLAVEMKEGEDHVLKIKLMIAGIWCIQMNPDDRPSMTKVMEMLEGKLESLQLPPKPFFPSPPRTPQIFSIYESSYSHFHRI